MSDSEGTEVKKSRGRPGKKEAAPVEAKVAKVAAVSIKCFFHIFWFFNIVTNFANPPTKQVTLIVYLINK